MSLPIGYWIAAASAPALIVASTSAIRRRHVPWMQNPDSEVKLPRLERPSRRTYKLVSVLAVSLLCAILAIFYYYGKFYAGHRPSQCALRGGVNRNVILERFKHQSRNFNSTPLVSFDKKVQTFFDAGMLYAYGFDHIEATAMFDRACQEDSASKCSMCTWAKAYALGPFVNRVCL